MYNAIKNEQLWAEYSVRDFYTENSFGRNNNTQNKKSITKTNWQRNRNNMFNKNGQDRRDFVQQREQMPPRSDFNQRRDQIPPRFLRNNNARQPNQSQAQRNDNNRNFNYQMNTTPVTRNTNTNEEQMTGRERRFPKRRLVNTPGLQNEYQHFQRTGKQQQTPREHMSHRY